MCIARHNQKYRKIFYPRIVLILRWLHVDGKVLNFIQQNIEKHLQVGIITSWRLTHLKALPNELGDFAVLGILLAADDEVNQAGSVPQNRGCVCLRDSHQTRRVYLSSKRWVKAVLCKYGISNTTAYCETSRRPDLDNLVVDPDSPVPIRRPVGSDRLDEDAQLFQTCVCPHSHA